MFQNSNAPLRDTISRRVQAGKTGAVAVLRKPDGKLALHTGHKTLPVIDIRIKLKTEERLYQWTLTDFCGTLLLDDHGPDLCEARIVICDENAIQILSSGEDPLVGQVLIVACGQDKDGKDQPVTGYAQFKFCGVEFPRSSVLWDASDEFLYFADLSWELAQGGDFHGIG